MLEPGFRIWLPGMLWHYNLHRMKLFKEFAPKKSNLIYILHSYQYNIQVMNLLCQGLYSFSDIWISIWTGEEELKLMKMGRQKKEEQLSLPLPILERNMTFSDSPLSNFTLELQVEQEALDGHYLNLGVYGAIVGALCATSMIRTVFFFVLCTKSSVALHNKMFESILRAPCSFFDNNPIGE